jgi:hypothetical protein
MLNRYAIVASLMIMLAWGAPRASASQEQHHVTWDALAVVVGQNVRIIMPDGSRIEGRATELQADALVVEIRKTTNKAAYPKGKFLVPRATLKALDVERNTQYWRIAGVSAGLGVGILVWAAGSRSPVYGVAAAAVPVAGYFLGRVADQRTITYVIAQ